MGSILEDYKIILFVAQKVKEAEKHLAEASKPWVSAAVDICREHRPDILISEDVRFEEKRFLVSCRGTGIYSHEEWWEPFPIETLLERMKQKKCEVCPDDCMKWNGCSHVCHRE